MLEYLHIVGHQMPILMLTIDDSKSALEGTCIRAVGHATDAEATAACRVIRSTAEHSVAQACMHGRFPMDEPVSYTHLTLPTTPYV